MRYFLLLSVLLFQLQLVAQQTLFEKTSGKETPTYFEVIDWYKTLDASSPFVNMKTMGQTDAGYPLHLVMISSDKSFDPAKWHQQKKVVILINNGIHPGEPDGIDASMMLVRDIIRKKIQLPSNIAIGLIPVYNIGGCLNRNGYTRVNQNGPVEYGFRGNAQNLDLNRDFTKCDSRNARSFTEIFHQLNPDIFIDNHVSDGADYQHTMTLITTQYDKLGSTLGSWVKNNFEPALYKSMSGKGWDMIPYVDFGASDFTKGIRMFMDPPRYSSGYAALFNTISFMPETHMLKPYKERVQSTYDLMVSFMQESSKKAADIKQQRAKAVAEWTNTIEFPLKWKADRSQQGEFIFKGYQRDSSLSEATGLQKMFYNHSKPFTQKIPFFNYFVPEAMIKKPKAYIIPAGWWAVIDLLRLNKVTMQQLKKDTVIKVAGYKIRELKSFPTAYEKHHKNYGVKTETTVEDKKFLKGDYIIYLNQESNRYIIEMLEPTGDDSFFAWNFFDAILQQKEGYSDYRWEDIAANVLKTDSSLQKKLAEKKAADSKFAGNSNAILDFIYRNSDYYEKAHNQYPVWRVE